MSRENQPKRTRLRELEDDIIAGWRQAVRRVCRPPKRSPTQRLSDQETLNAIARSEAAHVAELWDTYTQNRHQLGRNLITPKDKARAYLVGFHLANAFRMLYAWKRLESRTGWTPGSIAGPLVTHDWGCGSGAMTHALQVLRTRYAEGEAADDQHHCVDVSGALLDIVHEIAGSAAGSKDFKGLKTHRKDLAELPWSKFSTDNAPGQTTGFLLGYVLNEIAKRPKILQKCEATWRRFVAEDRAAFIAIAEPANQIICRNAMELRDRLVESGFRTLYPCPSSDLCPMRQRPKDWCYSEFAWKSIPPELKVLSQKTRIDHSTLSATVMIFATPKLAEQINIPSSAEVVVGLPKSRDQKSRNQITEILSCKGKELLKTPATSTLPLRGQTLASKK